MRVYDVQPIYRMEAIQQGSTTKVETIVTVMLQSKVFTFQ